jgi:hypothetical protein
MMINDEFPESEELERLKRQLNRNGTTKPWFVTAMALEELAEYSRDQPWNKDDAVRKIAEEATDLSWGLLARYLSVVRRLRAISSREGGIPMDRLLSNGFNAVEVAVRLYDRSARDGLAALRELHFGDLTLSQVRRMLENSKPGTADSSAVAKSRLLRKRGSEIESVERALEARGELIFGAGCRITRRPALRFFRRAGLEARIDGRIVGGADIMTPDASLKHDQLEAVLPTALLLAEFLPRFFLLFSPRSDDKVVERAKEALDLFDASSVGIIKVSEHDQLEFVREASKSSSRIRSDEYDVLKAKLLVVRKPKPVVKSVLRD